MSDTFIIIRQSFPDKCFGDVYLRGKQVLRRQKLEEVYPVGEKIELEEDVVNIAIRLQNETKKDPLR